MSRDCHRRLCAAVLQKSPSARLVTSHARPWASVTFSGARHWLTLAVPADVAARLADELPEAEFDLPGQLVADMTVVRQHKGTDGMLIDIEALTVLAD